MAYVHAPEVDASVKAAERVSKVILDLVGPVSSIVDVGGGTGAWCRAFKDRGVAQVKCLDHPSAGSANLQIDATEFIAVDFSRDAVDPVPADLALSLELGEHLPASRAAWLVHYLTQCAPAIVFSAAAPRQGGRGHINEQWPDYWQQLFHGRGYEQLDIVRPRIIADADIPFWYRANMFLYARDAARWNREPRLTPPDFFVVHRSTMELIQRPTLKQTLSRLVPSAWESIAHRLRRG